MAGRPLSYLTSIPVDAVKGIGPRTAKKLAEVDVHSVADLLLHVPRRYLDRSQLFNIAAVPLGEEVTIGGTVMSVRRRRIRGNRTMIDARITDGTSVVEGVWFNPYLRLEEGSEVALSGKVERFRGKLQMKSPDVDRLDGGESLITGRVVPVHPSLASLSPRQVRVSVNNALRRSQPVAEVLPEDLLDRLDLMGRAAALQSIHFPEELREVERIVDLPDVLELQNQQPRHVVVENAAQH